MPPPPVVHIQNLNQRYGKTLALDNLTLAFPAGKTIGLIGPDGVGKSSLLSLVAGARAIQDGSLEVLGGDMKDVGHRLKVCPKIAYMPQGLGKNLYPTLSVEENLQFFARLFGHGPAERRRRIDTLTDATGLRPFLERAAGKLSGGMKQKLGLCCSLIHDPDLLILDEPTTGVDPLARAQFWDLIAHVRQASPGMSVVVATAYMDEAQGFEWLIAMDAGKVLAEDSPAAILAQTGKPKLEDAFIQLLPPAKREGYRPVEIRPMPAGGDSTPAIEAHGLTKRFGSFTAVDQVSFTIPQGEIFGFLGSNGCGKTTTMKMLTGLLPASGGSAKLFGREVDANDLETRRNLGYMSQAFSLYSELTVMQNLILHARLFHIPERDIPGRVGKVAKRFGLDRARDSLPDSLPLGVRQRLSLAVAVVHEPKILILDEPTSGVDPVARDDFWRLIIELSRNDRVTIFVTTHFMNEAERCDRISLMHSGRSLVIDPPADIVKKRGAPNLESAFIAYLKEAGAAEAAENVQKGGLIGAKTGSRGDSRKLAEKALVSGSVSLFGMNLRRLLSCAWRESLELRRDPIRLALALLGCLILMLVMGYGVNLDVENLTYAVLDRDNTAISRNYVENITGSRFFRQMAPLRDYADLDDRMLRGSISMALEIPSGFGRDLQHGRKVAVGAWLDGSNPIRAETVQGYVLAMHSGWLQNYLKTEYGRTPPQPALLELRYRYNPNVESLPAMVPAVIAILLLMIPAVLAALSVVREKELGSILNLYTTPLTRSEFIIGKQLPYILLSFVSFQLMAALAITVFQVPIKGSIVTLMLGAILYCCIATGFGFLTSTVTKSQIAVIFLTMISTLLPAIQFSGLMSSVSSLSGAGRIIGKVFPTTYMLNISRGVFNKALGFEDLQGQLLLLLLTIPVVVGAAILCLKKQET